MTLTTIWTIPAISTRERLRRIGDDWFLRGLAHRLPRRLAYHSLIDSGVRYMEPTAEVPAVPFMDVVQRFGSEHDRMRA